MKKPQTPRTDASAKPTDASKADASAKPASEAISVDSKGNARASSQSSSPSSGDDAKSTTETTAKTADGNTSAKTASPKPEIKPAKAFNGNQDETSAGKTGTNANGAKSAPAKRNGGKALVLFVLIIVGALAAGWLTRALWWRDAQPVLAQYVPAGILVELAPEGVQNDQTTSTTTSPAPDTRETATTPSLPAPDETATAVEENDALITDNAKLPPIANSETGTMPRGIAPLPEGAVVVDPTVTERLSRLEGTIDALRERLNNSSGENLSNTVARRIAEIETRSATIEELARVENELAGVAKEMRELSARLSTMEEEVRATAGLRVESRGQAIAMAVTILRDALQRGGPFVVALNQLDRSAGDDSVIAGEIETLKPLAEHGAPTIENLRKDFPAMAQQAVQAATDDHSGSVLEATWANIKKLVPIRRIDAAGEESLEGRLVLAENAIEQDDLDAAITALEGIDGPHASAAVGEWLNNAKNRQTINQSIATLSAHAIGLLTGTGGDSQ